MCSLAAGVALGALVDEVHEVVFVDGIHLGPKAVVLIAQTREHVLGRSCGQDGEFACMGGAVESYRAPGVGGHRWGQRVREGPQERLAADAGAAVHLPCVQEDRTGDDDPPPPGDVQGAVRPGDQPPTRAHARGGRGVGELVAGAVPEAGGVPRREDSHAWR